MKRARSSGAAAGYRAVMASRSPSPMTLLKVLSASAGSPASAPAVRRHSTMRASEFNKVPSQSNTTRRKRCLVCMRSLRRFFMVQHGQQPLQIRVERRVYLKRRLPVGQGEPQRCGVEKQALQALSAHDGIECFVAVFFIARDRLAYMIRMHADLMGAAGQWRGLDQGGHRIPAQRMKHRLRCLALL